MGIQSAPDRSEAACELELLADVPTRAETLRAPLLDKGHDSFGLLEIEQLVTATIVVIRFGNAEATPVLNATNRFPRTIPSYL